MDISSSNFFSVSASTNKGMSGLISGMDTESMVEQMLSGTQKKITQQQQLLTQTEWKQEMYREVIDVVSDFRNKYFDSAFDTTLKTNFAKGSFFDTMTSSVLSGNAVSIVSTGSNAAVGETRVAVESLARAAKVQGQEKLSGDQKITGSELNLQSLNANLSKYVTLHVNNTAVAVNLNGVQSEKELTQAFNSAFQRAGLTNVTAKLYDGKLRFVFGNSSGSVEVVSEGSSALGLRMAGLTYLSEGRVTDADGNGQAKMFQSGKVDLDASIDFDITLDGVTKTISVSDFSSNGSASVSAESVANALKEQIGRAFSDYIQVDLVDNKLELSVNAPGEEGHQITMTGMDLSKFGIEPGSSTLLSMSSMLSDLGLTGDRFSFSINGVDFSFTGNDTLSAVVNQINGSKAGVRLSYSSLSDLFSLEATSSGAKFGIEIAQSEGDLLGRLLGKNAVSQGSKAVSGPLTRGVIEGTGLDSDYTTTTASLTMTVNGKESTFTLKSQAGTTYSKTVIENEFNNWLRSTYGVGEDGRANLSYSNGKLQIADGFVVSFSETKTDLENGEAVAEASKSDLALAMGFSIGGKNNIATDDTPVSEILQLQGATVLKADGTAADTLKEIAQVNGMSVAYAGDGRLSIEGSGDVSLTDSVLSSIFGAESLTLSDGKLADTALVEGADAKVWINGVPTTRSSNTFSIDGLTLKLSRVSPYEAGEYEETVIGTERDVEQIVDAFKSFVEDYNAMVTKLRDLTDAEATYREYDPLTAEQKKEMSEREIELWEEKAKEGLLRNDSTITTMLSAIRSALYTKPASSSYALFDIGLETTSYFSTDGGKGILVFDETMLRNALAADPESVKLLWTDAQDGLASKLMSALDSAVRTSGGTKGTLVELAGVKGSSTAKSNTLYNQMVSISERIKDLQAKYERERQRYWNQFNSMETIMNNYNAQSNMLSSYFSF